MSTKQRKFATLDDFILIKLLGSGFNCKVKLGYQESTKKYYAIKIIRTKVHVASNIKAMINEIQLLTKMKHPNIINLLRYAEDGTYLKKNGKTYQTKYVALELASNGELFGYISAVGALEETVCRAYFHNLIDALDYCHKNGVAHRDMKPENILLDDQFNLKISDFGFSTFFSRELTSHVGTKLYMAPEMHFDNQYFGPSVDLFATGIILFTMYTGLQPFENAANQKDAFYKLFYQNNLERYWDTVSQYLPKKNGKTYEFPEDFKQMISSLLAVDATHRPSIAEIRNMAWFKGAVASKEEVFAEMSKRKALVDKANEEERLKRQLERQQKMEEEANNKKEPRTEKMINQPPIGKRAHRGLDQESIVKLKLDKSRELFECTAEEKSFGNNNLDFVTDSNPMEVFSSLYELLSGKCNEVVLDEDLFKIKAKVLGDLDTLEIVVKLWKVTENSISVEFCKREGPSLSFYKIAKEIKENITKLGI